MIESHVVDGTTYEVHPFPEGYGGDGYGIFLVLPGGWRLPLPTREHMYLGITIVAHERGLCVTVDGEHWKGGTIQAFTWIVSKSGEIFSSP